MYDVDRGAARIAEIRSNPRLSPHQKHLQMLPILTAAKKALPPLRAELKRTQSELDEKNRFLAALEDMRLAWGFDWSSAEAIGHAQVCPKGGLQKNECSRLHRLAQTIQEGRILLADTEVDLGPIPPDIQSFIVSHDWAALVDEVTDAEIMLPSEKCAFEFRIADRTVIAVALQSDGAPPRGTAFYETKTGDWLGLGELTGTFWYGQIRAACIVLDAEVATHTVTRAPHALNAKRIKAGKPALYDFHVIDLDRRKHRAAPTDSLGIGSRKRLHFCRGHWRHYEASKTWIRWCLKGNPDLGFVDKEYRL